MGWILIGKSMHHDTTTLARYVPDLARDKFHVWITKYHYVPMIVLGVILLAIGGLPFLMWGIFSRTVFGLHTTWLVNSATHAWGSRRFQTRDHSTNSWWVALFSFGEGWHNNHHAHPVSARHGLAWYEIDFNWYGIWTLRRWAWPRRCMTAENVRAERVGAKCSAFRSHSAREPRPISPPSKCRQSFGTRFTRAGSLSWPPVISARIPATRRPQQTTSSAASRYNSGESPWQKSQVAEIRSLSSWSWAFAGRPRRRADRRLDHSQLARRRNDCFSA